MKKGVLLLLAASTIQLHINGAWGNEDRFLANDFQVANTITFSTKNVIVTFEETSQDAISAFETTAQRTSTKPRAETIQTLVNTMQNFAKVSQQSAKDIVKEIAGNLTSMTTFWISNSMLIKNANSKLIKKLREVPGVADVSPEMIFPLVTPVQKSPLTLQRDQALTPAWGVINIRAPDAWKRGYNGTGVAVGVIDTGVRGTHEALRSNFLPSVKVNGKSINYGWYDPINRKLKPYDDVGHGTHVTGTIVGRNGIGVAPGAKWMACKGCGTSGCPYSALVTCMQFMMCPTDAAGKNKDCSKAPRVINNSWGGIGGRTYFDAPLNALRAAGIIPVFSAGNSGPSCGTVGSPGDRPMVIAVGATDSSRALAYFSSKGPSILKRLKPDLSAPGVAVYSSVSYSDTSYRYYSGTSMASPHVVGTIALMLNKNKTLTFDQVKHNLQYYSNRTALPRTGNACGGRNDSTFPNNMYGYGIINAEKSVATVRITRK
jgi:subtilisin family serine protease